MTKRVLIAVIVLFLATASGYFYWRLTRPEPVACTLDAKQCPDGSWVGRVVPKCEFAVCPAPDMDISSWKSKTTAEGVSFRYPEKLTTKYIYVQEWPPQIEVKIAQFFCAEPLKKINSRDYCIGTQTEGAAGSIYTTYTYNTMQNDRLVSLRFTLRYVQCGNYGEPQKSGCEIERNAFNVDALADRIVQTVSWPEESPSAGQSGIRGIVMLGPICPVVKNPPEPQCADKPYQTLVAVFRQSDPTHAVAITRSNADGRFSFTLPSGNYTLGAGESRLPACGHPAATVSPNTWVDTTISCDTGIR